MTSNRVQCLPVLYALAILIHSVCAAPTPTMSVDTELEVDRFGNGNIIIQFKLSAQQWTIWKSQYGDRPDVLWRDLRYQFASFQLDNFELEKNDVERIATGKITMRGGPTLRGDGSRELEIPPEMQLVTSQGNMWVFSSTMQENPMAPIVNQTIKLRLPEEASNIRLKQAGTPFQALLYEVPEESAKQSLFLNLAIALLVLALVLGYLGFVRPTPVPATTS